LEQRARRDLAARDIVARQQVTERTFDPHRAAPLRALAHASSAFDRRRRAPFCTRCARALQKKTAGHAVRRRSFV
ncbi:TPA: hypothetical protein ACF6U4_003862, partial [Burkholderia multivorans]